MKYRLKETIQDSNINFLLGSGLSLPYLKTLGNIETWLTDLESSGFDLESKKIIKASLYKEFFDGVISKNPKMLDGDSDSKSVLASYSDFLRHLNSILLRRKSTILSKEVNLFTTNIDVFLEKALEEANLEFNDGFNGRFSPIFSLSNFKKSRYKRSLHYDNVSEIPVFNLLKLHGSLSWNLTTGNRIAFSANLGQVTDVIGKLQDARKELLDVANDATIATLGIAAVDMKVDPSVEAFVEAYEKLLIVNPTKEKFKLTLLNQTYYELLRLYANELEKENTVLFVMGFSFADEHIREITLRAANSNPTLVVYIIAHSASAKAEIEARFTPESITNRNIEFIQPPQDETTGSDKYKYDLATINKELFGNLFQGEDIADSSA